MTLFAQNYNRLSDEELLKLLAQNNEQAFKELYNRHIDFLYRSAMSRLGDDATAQDLVQEVFITLYTRRKEVGHLTEVKGWLFTCLRNRILNEIRNVRLHLAHHEQISALSDGITYAHNNYDLEVLELQYKKALDQLSSRSRTVFLLSRTQNMSNKSIAEKLQVSIKAVEKHMTVALKIMRRELAGKS